MLQCCREVAEKYPEITYEEVVIDNCCMMVLLFLSYGYKKGVCVCVCVCVFVSRAN